MSCNNCNNGYAYDEVSNYIKPGMKVVCVPFASEIHWQINGDFTQYKNQHFQVFESFGVNEEDISVVRLSMKRREIIRMLKEADIVFFSGGYMENIMFVVKALRLHGIINRLKEHKLFIGESAGTLALLNEYMEVPYIEDDYRKYQMKKGLGLLYGYQIIVHYQKDNPKHQKNKEVLAMMDVGRQKKLICLTDDSLFIFDNGETKLLGEYEVM
jgi:peptidase E